MSSQFRINAAPGIHEEKIVYKASRKAQKTRLVWTYSKIPWGSSLWKSVIFTDEKKFNFGGLNAIIQKCISSVFKGIVQVWSGERFLTDL